MRWIRLFVALVLALAATASGLGCSSEEQDPVGGKRALVMPGKGVRVADAPPELRSRGIAWFEARVRLLSTTTDRKGVAVSSESKRIGLAMDYVGHGPDGAPAVAGAIALDVAGLARLKIEPSAEDLAATLEGAPLVRLARRGDPPKPPLSHGDRAALVRGVVHAFAGGGQSPKDAGVTTAPATRAFGASTGLRPCSASGGQPGETCVDGEAPPDGCFHDVCDVADASVMAELASTIESTLGGIYKKKSCLAFVAAVGLTAADTAIVFDGPTELLLAGGATALARKCALDVVKALVVGVAKKEMLDVLKNVLCSSRDATLPELPELNLSVQDSMIVDVLNRVGLPSAPKNGDISGTYSAVADVFDTVRKCTCGVASMTDPDVAAGKEPVRAQRVVDADGRIACVPCAAGSHYDEDAIECVPDRDGDLIAVCTGGGDAALQTPCGQSAAEVRVIAPDLCLDVWVTRYTPEQAASGRIPAAQMTTIELPAPKGGGTWESAAELNFKPSYDACGTADTEALLVKAADEDDGPDDGLDYGAVRSRSAASDTGFIGYVTLLSPFSDANGNESLFPGHACAKDADGETSCIDVVPVDFVPHGPTDVLASPGFYWCGYKGSSCRDSAGRSVPPPGYATPYFAYGYGTDTCSTKPGDPPAAPRPDDPRVDDCAGKADGVHCSEMEGKEAFGYRCKAGERVAYTQCGGPNLACVETQGADEIVCRPPALNATDCGDKPDGWWCLDQGTGPGWMAYCKGKQIAGGCPCAACSAAGVAASCSAAPPPAACPI